jgi:DNA-binding NtrC family response regulator
MIIGLSGYAGVGKDTVAKYITEIDPTFKIKKFSGKLKEVASLLTGVPAKNFESQEFKHMELYGWDMTVRELLQRLGTEAIRDGLHEDAWVNALFADYHQGENWVITDMRFPNEYEAVMNWNGYTVRLERPNTRPVNNHPSEVSLDNATFHYRVINAKGEETWKELSEQLISKIKSNEKVTNYYFFSGV